MTIPDQLTFADYYSSGTYMIANVETGVLCNRSGRRMIALTNDFLIGLHRALEKECGDRVASVLKHCGRKWGKNFGKGLEDEWSAFYACPAKQFPMAFFQQLLIQEFAHNGWGILQIHHEYLDRGVLVIQLDGAIMSAITEGELGYPKDILTCGILAGLFSYFMETDLDGLQTIQTNSSKSKSSFLLADASRIANVQSNSSGETNHDKLLELLLNTSL